MKPRIRFALAFGMAAAVWLAAASAQSPVESAVMHIRKRKRRN